MSALGAIFPADGKPPGSDGDRSGKHADAARAAVLRDGESLGITPAQASEVATFPLRRPIRRGVAALIARRGAGNAGPGAHHFRASARHQLAVSGVVSARQGPPWAFSSLDLAAGSTRRRVRNRPPFSPRGLGETSTLSSSAVPPIGRSRRPSHVAPQSRAGAAPFLCRAASSRALASSCLALALCLGRPGFARPSHPVTGDPVFDGLNIGVRLGRKVSSGRTKSV